MIETVVTASVLGAAEALLSLKKVPEDRPYVGLVTCLGKRTNTWEGPGYTFLPWPFFDFIPIYVGIRNQTIEAEAYSKEGDRIKFKFRVNIHWLPDTEKPDELENYIEAGGATGILEFQSEQDLEKFDWAIRQKLADLVKEVIKNFASTHEADECVNVTDQIYEKIIERLTGVHNEMELKQLIERFKGKDRLRIAERWGLTIDSVFVEPVHPTPEMENVLQQKAKEKRDREAEFIEMDTENEQAQKILAAAKAAGIDFEDFADAYRLVKDYKTVRENHGFVFPRPAKGSGVIEDFIQILAAAFLDKKLSVKDATINSKKSKGEPAAKKDQEEEQVVRIRR
ncbi:MAG: SPFH domain-containing protein, partial [bacterium]|nr:SPFH domain-containing protein [bacterium]